MVEDLVRTGGKRLRPLLLLLAAKAFTYERDRAVTAAAGVELLHTASLIHDDNIDRAALRRGQPTLNTELSSGAVILIGDFLFAQSAILAAATDDVRVVSIFANSLGAICDGQLRETLDAHRLNQDRAAYERRIYGKTASLFAGAAEMGAVVGGASDSEIRELRDFGGDVGMAFQIVDDILDLREGTDVLGKPSGNDIRQGVVTLPTMIFIENQDPEGSVIRTLSDVIAGTETREEVIEDLISQIRRSGTLEEAEAIAADYSRRARARLSIVEDAEIRGYLEEIVDLTLIRSR
ncbi:MAG TPA: polyprenyl synthetase family protein [Thermomicrobiales bacterium]|nr:polyprenyl synthetase family protein [Thermomicrobiales bacterium]